MKTSKPEQALLEALKADFPSTVGDYLIPDVRLAGKHLIRVDCYIPEARIVVEYDGYYWHKKRKRADTRKARMLTKNGYTVVRVREEAADGTRLPILEVAHQNFHGVDLPAKENLEEVLSLIRKLVKTACSD